MKAEDIALEIFKNAQRAQELALQLLSADDLEDTKVNPPAATPIGLPPKPIPIPAPIPAPAQEIFYLPKDDDQAEMTAVYGPAAQNFEARLDWFRWPGAIKARLYDRDGAHIVDHTPGDSSFADDHRTHKLLAPRLTAALQEIYNTLGTERFISEGWHVWGGSHNYRPTTGGGYLSTHARAAAVDINPTENGYRSKTTTFSDQAVNIMEKHGFLWAWRAWVNTRDPMHFSGTYIPASKGSYYDKNGYPKWIRPLSEKP